MALFVHSLAQNAPLWYSYLKEKLYTADLLHYFITHDNVGTALDIIFRA